MVSLVVRIEQIVDDHFPQFVGCSLIDADGVRHEFVEKVPVVSKSEFRAESHFPQPGYIDCTIEDEWRDDKGRDVIRVNTEKPWSIESVVGVSKFVVFKEQVHFG